MTDPLAQFRKHAVGSKAITTGGTSDGYEAFGTRDRVERLRIRRANDMTRSPSYGLLWDVTYAPLGTSFVLVYSYMAVLVRGKNLQPIINALELGTADFIQEFDNERWKLPSDPAAPVIEAIDVTMASGTSGLEGLEHPNQSRSKPH